MRKIFVIVVSFLVIFSSIGYPYQQTYCRPDYNGGMICDTIGQQQGAGATGGYAVAGGAGAFLNGFAQGRQNAINNQAQMAQTVLAIQQARLAQAAVEQMQPICEELLTHPDIKCGTIEYERMKVLVQKGHSIDDAYLCVTKGEC